MYGTFNNNKTIGSVFEGSVGDLLPIPSEVRTSHVCRQGGITRQLQEPQTGAVQSHVDQLRSEEECVLDQSNHSDSFCSESSLGLSLLEEHSQVNQ